MIKSILCGLFVSGLLFGCSHYNDRVSATADSSSKDTTASVLDTKEVSSPYIDTLLITFSDNQPYTIYVEEYSKEGPEGSLRHFVMVDPQGKEVFRSFNDDLEIAESSFDEQWVFALYPCYQIIKQEGKDKLEVDLLYYKSPFEQNIYDSEAEVPEAFLPIKAIATKGNMYIVGSITSSRYNTLYEGYPCKMSFDSLAEFYNKEKVKNMPAAIELLGNVFNCSLQNRHKEMYDKITLFSINTIHKKIEFYADYEKYYYLYKFLTYHAWHPSLN